MSPASSGTLEVEKYIGACLISQSTRPKSNYYQEVYNGKYLDSRYRIPQCNTVDRWAGGMPLISFANYQRRDRRLEQHQADGRSSSPRYHHNDDQHNPLTRLAVHTQGAPLILSKNYGQHPRRRNKNNPPKDSTSPTNKSRSSNTNKCNEPSGSSGVDTVSVTSDESSGSTNSDTFIPRIIKPRKRRKKDRKPTLLGRPLNQDGFSTDSASPDIDSGGSPGNILRSYIPFVFEPHTYRLVPENLPLTHHKPDVESFVFDASETPQLHHSFDDVEELDDGVDINGNQSTCQCRYCDPSGQIWDVDRSCYSPFLTAPTRGGKSFQFTNNSTAEESLLSKYSLVSGMGSISLDEDNNKDRGSFPSRDLEVSSEIVTSLNGHRDIEIKFFSAPSVESVRPSSLED